MKVSQARSRNERINARFEKSISNIVRRISVDAIPKALDRIGEKADSHSERTKTYTDRTGNLRSGYAHVVVPPKSSEELVWKSKDGGGTEIVTNDTNEIQLIFGNPVRYAIYVEMIHGFDVSIQTFIFLRRQLRDLLTKELRSFKLF